MGFAISLLAARASRLALGLGLATLAVVASAGELPAATAVGSDHFARLAPLDDERLALRPLLEVQLNGHPARLLLDTGASAHALSQAVARRLALASARLGEMSNHFGTEARESGVAGAVITAGGWTLSDGQPLASLPLPPSSGFGGLLSPQLLASGAEAIVLDLAHGRLASMPWDAAASTWSASGVELAGSVRVCQVGEAKARRLFVLAATIDGLKLDLLLDTGAERSTLRRDSEVGQRLAAYARPAGTSYSLSEAQPYSVLPGARLALGPFHTALDLPLIEGKNDPECPHDGALGMDVLRHCVIAISGARLLVRCPDTR